jgi:hypothetical protein
LLQREKGLTRQSFSQNQFFEEDMSLKEKWSVSDFALAMEQSVKSRALSKCLKTSTDKLVFNGFWRDGDHPNVCLWRNKATWADAKTGEGGGCKEFAKIAFNLSLPEFMERYGPSTTGCSSNVVATKKPTLTTSVHGIWTNLVDNKTSGSLHGERWLEQVRGFASAKENIGSGFLSLAQKHLDDFDVAHRNFISQRLALGPQLVVPIRNSYSNDAANLFFRAISDVRPDEKSRLLPGYGGWTEKDSSPRAFGFPHLIQDFPKIILCEGMADYFATECLLGCDDNYLAVGVANASALSTWASWLVAKKFKGNVTILYQLDKDRSGKISPLGIGQAKALQALKTLLHNKISASLFNWPRLLKHVDTSLHQPNDIADLCKSHGSRAMSEHFMTALNEVNLDGRK